MLISLGFELNRVMKRLLAIKPTPTPGPGLTMVPVPAGAHSLSGLIGPLGGTLMDLPANSRWS